MDVEFAQAQLLAEQPMTTSCLLPVALGRFLVNCSTILDSYSFVANANLKVSFESNSNLESSRAPLALKPIALQKAKLSCSSKPFSAALRRKSHTQAKHIPKPITVAQHPVMINTTQLSAMYHFCSLDMRTLSFGLPPSHPGCCRVRAWTVRVPGAKKFFSFVFVSTCNGPTFGRRHDAFCPRLIYNFLNHRFRETTSIIGAATRPLPTASPGPRDQVAVNNLTRMLLDPLLIASRSYHRSATAFCYFGLHPIRTLVLLPIYLGCLADLLLSVVVVGYGASWIPLEGSWFQAFRAIFSGPTGKASALSKQASQIALLLSVHQFMSRRL
ncbi:hypothetical protein R3P38DRAFT_2774964 [Favolaschia claudopus]|uniref:Uncharacterized protein n=1 Tax=Favolaschia claudopus TaxID=2862362 RepID=A0AAW0BUT7_9AGAR